MQIKTTRVFMLLFLACSRIFTRVSHHYTLSPITYDTLFNACSRIAPLLVCLRAKMDQIAMTLKADNKVSVAGAEVLCFLGSITCTPYSV